MLLGIGGTQIDDADIASVNGFVDFSALDELDMHGIGYLSWLTGPSFTSDLNSLDLENNNLGDLAAFQPLGDYWGWDSGGYLDLTNNPFDPNDPGIQSLLQDLQVNKGVTVEY